MDSELTGQIAEFIVDWCPTGPIDWDDMLYRVETRFELDLPESMLSDEIRAIKRAVYKLRAQS